MYAVPGGLIAVGLDIDPALSRSDRLLGNVILLLFMDGKLIFIGFRISRLAARCVYKNQDQVFTVRVLYR